MRTTDDLNPERFQPLGPKAAPTAPPTAPEWRQKPGAAPGVEIGPGDRLRTNIPANEAAKPWHP